MPYKSPCTFLLLCAFTLPALAQYNAPSFNPAINPVPKTPEAASLIKFIEAPVSKATGIPDIQIPVVTLKEGDMELPVTLSYHSGGHRVSEMAAWTGLGWRLNAGGSITRQVKGIPDDTEKGQGFLQFRTTQTYNGLMDKLSTQNHNYFFDLSNGCYDTQPDEFYFQMGKYSGRFAFDWTGALPVVSSKDDIKVLSYTILPNTKTIASWRLVAPDGYIYDFGTTESTVVNNGNVNLQAPCLIGQNQYNSSWILTKITSPYNQSQYIEFIYDTYTISGSWDGFEIVTFPDPGRPKPSDCNLNYQGTTTFSNSRSTIWAPRLKQIIMHPSNTILECLTSTVRTDLSGTWSNNNGGYPLYALDTIQVKNRFNKLINRSIFNYDYSTGRLTLKSFRQDGIYGANPGKYEFTYYPGYVPDIVSKSVDHWGFNNNNNNFSLVPKFKYAAITGSSGSALDYAIFNFNGADREPKLDASLAGILWKMKQPTGGVTTFDYELNTYSKVNGNSLENQNEYYYKDSLVECLAVGIYNSSDWVYSSKTVEVTEPGVYEVVIRGSTWATFGGSLLCPRASISKQDGTTIYAMQLPNHDGSDSPTYQYLPRSLFLSAGTYILSAQARYYIVGHPIGPDEISIFFTTRVKGGKILEKTAGGLRVKDIRFRTDATSIPITRHYEYKLNNGRSSGYVYAEPVYQYNGKTLGVNSECLYFNMVASSQVMTAGTQGNHAGYTNVTEYFGPNGEEGKIESEYSFHSDVINTGKPFAPPTSENYRNGLPLRETIYKRSGNDYVRQKQTTTTYLEKPYDINSMKISYGLLSPPAAGASMINSEWYSLYPFEQKFAFWWSPLRMGFVQTASVTDSVWENGLALGKTVNMGYDASGRYLKQMSQMASNNDVDDQFFKYPQEYTVSGSPDAMALALGNLVSKNILSLPVESYTRKNGRVIKGNIVKYSMFNMSPLPSAYLSLEPTAPLTSFTESNLNAGTFTLAPDYHQKRSYNTYRSDGKLLEQTPTGDIKTAYIWDNSGNNLQAEVKNAAAKDIFQTSFEYEDNGNWTISNPSRDFSGITGQYSYNIAGGVSLTGLTPATSYTLTCWGRGASLSIPGSSGMVTGPTINGWTLYEYKLTGISNLSITGSGLIDELRVYPSNARMVSFTYTPGVGITSRCDVNNRISYYQYDDQNRLAAILDEQGNIIKKLEYHYQQ